MIVFVKGLLGGLAAVLMAWIFIVAFFMWRLHLEHARQGISGSGAVAGGWGYWLSMPLVAMILGLAFAAGLYVTVRLR